MRHLASSPRSITSWRVGLPLLVLIALVLATSGAWAGRTMTPTGLLSPEQEVELDSTAHRLMEKIYEGRIGEAEAALDELFALAPDDPRTHLMHARLLREFLSDQNTHRASIEDQTGPVEEALERAHEACERLLEQDEGDVAGRLYRGWAKMFEAQLHTLTGSYWSAGRTSKKAKEDLDFVLERDPGNPHAKLVLGSFYYFADRLPGVLKFAAWLLRIPTGDRDLGLEFLRTAHEERIVGHRDAQAILGLIHFAFETRFEQALPVFEDMSDRYPANARLVEPFVMIDFYWPQRLADDRPRVERCLERSRAIGDSLTWANAQRLRFYHLLGLAHTGHAERARAGFESLLDSLPPQPDWLEPSVRIALADLHLLDGDADGARRMVEPLEEGSRPEEWMRYLREEEDVAATPGEVEALRRLQPAARALYDHRFEEAERGLDRVDESATVAAGFYRAELHFLRGELAAARRGFERLAEEEDRDRYYFLRLLSRLRLGEIEAAEGDFDRAEDRLDEAVDRHRMKDLFRHVADGRRRLFEETDYEVPTAAGLSVSPPDRTGRR